MQNTPCTATGTHTVCHTRGNHRTQSWSLHAVAGAVVLATTLITSNAWGLALGRVTIQSRLGEPLRAEIDVPSSTADEMASLQLGIAPPEAFKAASMEYNTLLQDVTLSLQRRPDGRPVLRVSSQRVVTEPFLDMVVEAQWAGGKIVRGYTLLLDPPNLRQPPAPQQPATAPAVAAPAEPAKAVVPDNARTAPGQARPATVAEANKVRVKRGDTAGRIAEATKPASVSLDQMLIGLLRANPEAFVGRNVNRLKAGALLDIPDEATIASIPAAEARRQVVAQSRDFNEYRRRLAAAAPAQAAETASRQASGTVQSAEVKTEEAKPATPDKLTLSKGAVASKGSAEEQIAEQRRKTEASERESELKRNLDELKQLNTTASAPAVSEAPPLAKAEADKAAAPGVPVEAPVAAPPAVEPPAPVPEPPKPVAPPPPPAPASGGWVSDVLSNPLALPVGGGLVAALLGALAVMRIRKRKSAAEQPHAEDDSRFEAAGGQVVDTSEEEAAPSSMMYSPSQLDAAGDVDPVAEADVYLAYGRDKQAEEILLEALRLHPDRMPVRLKLLEIYAQRNDLQAFQSAATEVHELTGGTGPDWEQARDMGYALEPDNALYRPTGNLETPATPMDEIPEVAAAPTTDVDLGFGSPATEAPAEPVPEAPAVDDNHIDFDLPAPQEPEPEPAEEANQPPMTPDSLEHLDFDLDLSSPEVPERTPETAEASDLSTETQTTDHSLDFDLDLSEIAADAETASEPVAVTAPQTLPQEVQDFSLDFDLSDATPAPVEAPAEEPDFDALSNLEVNEGADGANPLETKLSLAREFEAIGDAEGARSLAEEVAAEATGELQEQARAFLSQLS